MQNRARAAGHKAHDHLTLCGVTRYGFAIKALPKGGKPFGDDDENQDHDAADEEGADAGAPLDTAEPDAALAVEPAADALDAEAEPDAETPEDEMSDGSAVEPQVGDGRIPEDESGGGAPLPPEDDARPWSGDMYDEGDETDPSSAFAAYQGASGDEAWLDQAPDGTLTGWVRDATGQVWRYTDPDVWAIDVDDAQMTRTHSQAPGGEDASADHGGQDPLFPPKQS
ncbi:hypothetical protein U9R90_26765 [Streptomyces sp. E11-3]|uniref:hypothetical protein n=1 Tax=Streptomyces sp. E11-3 TaxID=3110112 RepID=UPI00397F86C0